MLVLFICVGLSLFFFFFFFSSRRRHTRSLCDWSSDVCSSDLRVRLSRRERPETAPPSGARLRRGTAVPARVRDDRESGRESEERRVGKECRSRWLAYH